MSVSRKSRKLTEEQPQIHQFIVNSGQSQTAQTITLPNVMNSATPPDITPKEPKGKKRRRSTGEKVGSPKKRNPAEDHIADSNTMADAKTDPNSATTAMIREIKKMEERLSEKITTSKDQEIVEMEERLNSNIRTTIDTSIKNALRVIQTSLNSSVENNPIINSHSTQLKDLREENSRLNRKVQQLTAEQGHMKQQLNKLENRSLENSLIIRGVTEVFKGTEQVIIDQLHRILSKIMQGDTEELKLANAKQITIKSCHRLGRPSKQRIRPVSIEFYHKQDVEFILENRFDLGRVIYVDKEYPMDIERKRKTLLPILRAAKRTNEFNKQSKLEDDKIVLKG